MSYSGFNLLQDNTLPPDIWDKWYDWISKAGKIIVVVVEITVIVCFVLRIVVDTQAKALAEELQTNIQRLNSFKDNEARFIAYQQRFTAYKAVWRASPVYSTVIGDIVKLIPANTDNLTFTLKENVVTITGEGVTTQLGELESVLKSSQDYKDVQLNTFDTLGARAKFSIKVEIRTENVYPRKTGTILSIAGSSTTATPVPNSTNVTSN